MYRQSQRVESRSEPCGRGGADRLRILEIGFHPLIKNNFPAQTRFIDTRFRWSEIRTYEMRQEKLPVRLASLAGSFSQALRACIRQKYDVVVTRCLGPVNSFGQSPVGHAGRVLLGLVFQFLVLFAARGARVKLAVIDVTDHLTIHRRDRKLASKCDLYFKRELADNHWHTLEPALPRGAGIGDARYVPAGKALRSKLRPFALGIEASKILEPIPSAEKQYDVFYSGTASGIPVREALGGALERMGERGWKIFAPRERISAEEFQCAIRQSRLCLSPGGVGWDCYRHYEIVAYGSVPVINFRPLHSISPFRDGAECFYFDPQDDVVERLEQWLRLPPLVLDEMAQAAQERLRRHYTSEALAAYVVDEIRMLGR